MLARLSDAVRYPIGLLKLRRKEFAPLRHVPLDRRFLLQLKYQSKGIYEHPDGLILKVGTELEKTITPTDDFTLELYHHDYAVEFPVSAYGSRAGALEAAVLHARFYKKLARDGFMAPGTQVVLHAGKRGNPALTVLQPKLAVQPPTEGFRKQVAEIKQRLASRYPAGRGFWHADLSVSSNYGTLPAGPDAPEPALRAKNPAGHAIYLHDLHVFNKPHAPETIEFLRHLLRQG